MSIYFQLFCTFLKIGFFTLGGGYAMIPLIESEVVDKKHWLTKVQFLDYLVLAQTAPGILAVNISILAGKELRGKKGAVTAVLGTVFPSFFIILFIAVFFTQFQETEMVNRIFRAVRPAVVALIAVPVFNLAKTAKLTWKTACIPVASVLLIWLLGVSPILIIISAAFLGILICFWKEKREKK
ncbi:MAG: chromate transporter [Prevotellaceae bacterium]|jgi:chromate transporter|nr:chromate transporter [Prevotellaceae bacterium]